MLNKKFMLISLLCFVIFSNSFAKKRPLKISSEQQTYYKRHQWDFLEKIFIDDTKNISSHYNYYRRLSFVIPFLITPILIEITDENGGIQNVLDFALVEFCTSFVSLGSWFITKHLLSPKKKNDKLITALECFLQNYDPDLEKDLEINYKRLVPEEFHETFDGIHAKYLQDRRKYLKKYTLDVIRQIRRRILSEKYKKPVVLIS